MIYKKEEIKKIARSCKILAQVMRELKVAALPDVATEDLDKLARELISKAGAKPAFLGYEGFPAVLCASINEQIVHAVPSDRKLKSGDIFTLDLGLIYDGFYSDMAVTVPIGKVEPEVLRLIRVTKKALKRAIGRCKPGKTLGDVGQAVEEYIKGQGFRAIKELCGHGVGRKLHEEPEILNFGQRHKGLVLKEGMVLALEPMASMGNPAIKKGPDGFCWQTVDDSLSAQFEHTIVITKTGAKILTE